LRPSDLLDTTKKILFRLEDGLFIESVLIPAKVHWTVCISTQAGCGMRCRFLPEPAGTALKRKSPASEITGQITMLQQYLPEGPDYQEHRPDGHGRTTG